MSASTFASLATRAAPFALFQAAWLATALLAARHHELAPAPMVAFALLHVAVWSRARMASLVLAACAAALGALVDGALVELGAIALAQRGFMVALWVGFACTLETTLTNVRARPLVGALLGGVTAPLAYRAGGALGALHLPEGADALVQIGVAWAVALPALAWIARALAVEKIARRARTLPRLALFFAVLVPLAPVWLALAALVDVARGKRSWPTGRVVAFGVWFVLVEVWTVSLALLDVLFTGGEALLDRTYARQQLFTRLLLAGVRRVFRLRFVIEGDDCAAPAPVLVLARHASIIDTLLPSVFITQGRGVRLRFVLKRELLEDPCMDVAGTRLPNHFVSRRPEDHARDVAAVEALARGLRLGEGLLIYPEGTRFTPAKRAAAVGAVADDELRALAVQLAHVLPPKPGGAIAALAGAANADVVFLAHRGLDGFAKVADIWSGALVDRTVRVKLWRVARREVPLDPAAQRRWLFEQWARLDQEVGAMEAA